MSGRVETKSVRLTWLKSHPRQDDFFADTSEAELRELAADMELRGQQEPIHCCSDGTIIRGHRRVQAAELLGWEKIRAVIRSDLGDADDDAVVDELITDNLMRRQLDDLSLARCYRQLKRSYVPDDSDETGDVRDRLAARLNSGKSGRSLDRLERLLDLPRDIQDMISRGDLNKSHGEKILKLPEKKRDKLFNSLRAGEPVVKVLRHHGVINPATAKTPNQLGQELLDFLNHNVKKLDQNMEDLDRLQVRGAGALRVLDQSVDFLTAWRDRKQSLFGQSVDAIRPSCVGIRDAGQNDQNAR
jgi:ParB/RepB/Spo0J family partition protein